jgi:chromate reductase, NAD(P)H dehydrogenase (quinone)
MRILAISGSLRTGSSNTMLLRAAVALAPEAFEVSVYDGLATLPHFNPDLDNEAAPPPVVDFRSQLHASDGVLISSPEYAHGVPGVLKNALDWVVASGELYGKPVALLNRSPRSVHAQASLRETLTVMTASLIPEASITVSLRSNKVDEASIISDPGISHALRSALEAFGRAIDLLRANAGNGMRSEAGASALNSLSPSSFLGALRLSNRPAAYAGPRLQG